MVPNIHHREHSKVFLREPAAESFTEVSTTPGSLASLLPHKTTNWECKIFCHIGSIHIYIFCFILLTVKRLQC